MSKSKWYLYSLYLKYIDKIWKSLKNNKNASSATKNDLFNSHSGPKCYTISYLRLFFLYISKVSKKTHKHGSESNY